MEIKQLKEQITGFLRANQGQGFTAQNLADGLRLNDAAGYRQVVSVLEGMVDAKSAKKEGDTYQFQNQSGEVIGEFKANDKGFGFVRYDDVLPDYFIAPDNTGQAMQGDAVRVSTVKPAQSEDRGPEGKVEEIIEHAYQRLVGVFTSGSQQKGILGQIRLNDKKAGSYQVLVSQASADLELHDGQVVVADVARFADKVNPKQLLVKVTQILGYENEPGMDIMQIVENKKVPNYFPDEVMAEADAIPNEVQPEEWQGRVDATDQPLVTIDGADTKDIDDAVVVWKKDNGNYHLGVHIADVSHYVRPGSAIDKEAYNRGTSVYLTDRVIPMLPQKLSNGIASLNPDVVRLAMSVEMEIDSQGRIVKHDIHQSVIKSHARMTYTAVNEILAGKEDTRAQYEGLVPMFEEMGELHQILYKMRSRRGAIEFDTPEASIVVDQDGKAIDVVVRERGTAERMIESFMLAANETIAEHYDRLKVPFLYRIHEVPDEDRAQSFFEFAKTLGYPVQGDPAKVTPMMLQGLMERVKDDPAEQMISTMMLRAMKQAKYSPDPMGHFGLGADYYTHFTSPIRRYPDLTVHRLIKWYAANGTGVEAQEKYASHLGQIGEDTSTRERRAIDTERLVDAMKKAEYMEDKVGQEFDGVVNAALKFGLFVSLENTVEGLVHISNLTDDHYEYDEKHAALIGRSKHHIFQIGQKVRVKVLRANKEESTVDFILLNPNEAPTTEIRVPQKDNGKFGRGRGRGNGNRRNQGRSDKGQGGKSDGQRGDANRSKRHGGQGQSKSHAGSQSGQAKRSNQGQAGKRPSQGPKQGGQHQFKVKQRPS
ncbi:exoribonuclease R [Fructobacillus pseudoficulneus]|uniref:Ribonuclease R n=1 Tax=Fructobacillus pseudoficulneus TaxID=220714 RepID=A0A3F3GUF9_9LACO|nr:ribonuclease R [Fructobacillus pseudoficulneus]GAP02995.1 exoribonuclease R [Fructobacillus pseudoficulneus]SEH44629.1 ribonuclease R [Fructobacillus pseudoficulneus]